MAKKSGRSRSKQKRPNIPEDVKLKLWVLSGGRCEFPGCNKLLWRDGLTLKEDNYSHKAHIIAQSIHGPRGEVKLSNQMAIDFSNLMLLCLDHSKLIDGKNKADYPPELLRSYKEQHEARIQLQTSVQDGLATTVLRFIANIGERPGEVVLPHTYKAILPRYPADDKGVVLDYTSRAGDGDSAYWKSFADEITVHVKQALAPGNNKRIDHLSIFSIGPMPLLMHLGNQIGNIIPSDLYQKHRDTQDWSWKPESRTEKFDYIVRKSGARQKTKKVALVLSLSGKVEQVEIDKAVPGKKALYEITIPTPDVHFLDKKFKLEKFRVVYRSLVTEIREKHGASSEIHILGAFPAPIAVICGKELLPKADPKVFAYDYNKAKGGFVKVLKIN